MVHFPFVQGQGSGNGLTKRAKQKDCSTRDGELPQIVQTVQRRLPKVENKILSNKLISFFKRSQFCFCLNTVIIVEVDVF